MRVDERLVVELPTVDTLTARPVALRHVAALDHKVLDHPVKLAVLVTL